MNISTTPISFKGVHTSTNADDRRTEKTFTNDEEVLLTLEHNILKGDITNPIVKKNQNVHELSFLLDDKFQISARKQHFEKPAQQVTINVTDKDKTRHSFTLNDKDKNISFNRTLTNFMNGLFKKITCLQDQSPIYNTVIELLAGKK